MPNENDIPLLLLEGSIQGCYKLLEEIATNLQTEKTDTAKKKFLKKKKKEVQIVISHQKILLKDLLAKSPEIYNLIIGKWIDLQKFIEDQINIFEEEKSENEEMGRNQYGIKWVAPHAHLMELIYALIATPHTLIYKNKEDVVKAFSHFFGLKLTYASQKLSNIKQNRNLDNRTIFLDKLTKSFEEYINKVK